MMESYEDEKMIDEAMFGIGDQEGRDIMFGGQGGGRGVMFGGEGLEGHGSAVLGGRGDGRGIVLGGGGLEGRGIAVIGGRGDGRGIVLGGGWRSSEVIEGWTQRRSAFTSTEKTLLMELFDQYKKVIENKRTGNFRKTHFQFVISPSYTALL